MRVRAIDADGDWLFGKGVNDYKSGLDAIAQNIQTRLQSFLGDCFFEQTAGIDWFNLLGNKNQLALNLAVSAVILNTENVTGIISLSMSLSSTRELVLQYEVSTSLGTVEVEKIFNPSDFLLTESGNTLLSEGGKKLSVV